jgi:Domain of unknown function (DUF4145)
MNTSEDKFTGPIICGHCNNKLLMKIVAEYSQIEDYSDDKSGLEWQAGPVWELRLCPACSGVTFGRYWWHELRDPEDIKWETIFPSVSKKIRSLPPTIEKEYDAAEKVRNIDNNAYAALIRRVLEAVFIDKGASGNTLVNKIVSLGKTEAIPVELKEMALHLNTIAKIGAHASIGVITPFELPLSEALCRNILIYVYEIPALIKQAESKIELLKKRMPI